LKPMKHWVLRVILLAVALGSFVAVMAEDALVGPAIGLVIVALWGGLLLIVSEDVDASS
jgi:hypothetical protein